MLRCISVDKETLIASNCDKEDVKKLSNEKKLICPNCQSSEKSLPISELFLFVSFYSTNGPDRGISNLHN